MTVHSLIDWRQPINDLETFDRKPYTKEQYAVESDSDPDQAYIVRRLGCLRVPFDEADVVDDSVDVWTCSCMDYRHRKWYDDIPDEIMHSRSCKHIERIKEEADDQTTEITYHEQ